VNSTLKLFGLANSEFVDIEILRIDVARREGNSR
jgi:hypothetical protein